MKGYIHLYTGNGKGKTTAALGLALRAVGAGKRVFIAQFVKGMPYAEIDAISRFLPGITLKQYGLDCFIFNDPTPGDIAAARAGLDEVARVMQSGGYDMIILDEACIAIQYHLFSIEELLRVIQLRDKAAEIIITGRYARPELIELADLVTEMKMVKHYYEQGVDARKGIEY
jgi:cob(I)alamin adenosyltransferase